MGYICGNSIFFQFRYFGCFVLVGVEVILGFVVGVVDMYDLVGFCICRFLIGEDRSLESYFVIVFNGEVKVQRGEGFV